MRKKVTTRRSPAPRNLSELCAIVASKKRGERVPVDLMEGPRKVSVVYVGLARPVVYARFIAVALQKGADAVYVMAIGEIPLRIADEAIVVVERSGINMADPERDPQNLRQSVAESPEFKVYMEKLFERLPSFARRAAAVPAGAEGSVEWLADIGRFWWEAREERELSRDEVARRMEVDADRIRLLEVGLSDKTELNPDFLQGYAGALGEPSLYDQCVERFVSKPS